MKNTEVAQFRRLRWFSGQAESSERQAADELKLNRRPNALRVSEFSTASTPWGYASSFLFLRYPHNSAYPTFDSTLTPEAADVDYEKVCEMHFSFCDLFAVISFPRSVMSTIPLYLHTN